VLSCLIPSLPWFSNTLESRHVVVVDDDDDDYDDLLLLLLIFGGEIRVLVVHPACQD